MPHPRLETAGCLAFNLIDQIRKWPPTEWASSTIALHWFLSFMSAQGQILRKSAVRVMSNHHSIADMRRDVARLVTTVNFVTR